MKWATKIGTIRGINVYIHFTFWLIVIYVGAGYWKEGSSLSTTLVGVFFVLSVFLCVLLHEFGHALTALKFGIKTKDITLLPIGGLARLEKIPENPYHELWITVAGPVVNALIALILYIIINSFGVIQPLEKEILINGPFLQRLMIVNIVIFIFNLLPAFPMDGGRILRALLAMNMSYSKATKIAVNVGQLMAVLFGIFGYFTNPFLIIIALFVWIGATMEGGMVQIRHELYGVPVKDAMITKFNTLNVSDTLETTVDLIISGTQKNFPVLESGKLVGILGENNIMKGLSEKGKTASVSQYMIKDFETANEFDRLETVFMKFQNPDCKTIPVFHNNKFTGIVTLENLREFISIKSAIAKVN